MSCPHVSDIFAPTARGAWRTAYDDACVLPRGFVRLHDAAATGRFSNASGDPDETPAGIALSTVASTITSNYERCHENAEQLTALQVWIRKMEDDTK